MIQRPSAARGVEEEEETEAITGAGVDTEEEEGAKEEEEEEEEYIKGMVDALKKAILKEEQGEEGEEVTEEGVGWIKAEEGIIMEIVGLRKVGEISIRKERICNLQVEGIIWSGISLRKYSTDIVVACPLPNPVIFSPLHGVLCRL